MLWVAIRWLVRLWHKRQRDIDIQLLWPTCRDVAPEIDVARAAFACHALHDSAWAEIGEDEIIKFISTLE